MYYCNSTLTNNIKRKIQYIDLSKFSKVNMATGMLTFKRQSSKKIIVHGSEAQNLSARRKNRIKNCL